MARRHKGARHIGCSPIRLQEIWRSHKRSQLGAIESDEMFDTEGFPPNWQGKNRGKGFAIAFNHGIVHTGQILEIKRMLGKGAWGF